MDELPDHLLRDPVPYSAPQRICDFYTGFLRLRRTELKALLHTSLAPLGLVSRGQPVLGVFRFASRALIGLPISPLVLSTVLMRPPVESQCRFGESERRERRRSKGRSERSHDLGNCLYQAMSGGCFSTECSRALLTSASGIALPVLDALWDGHRLDRGSLSALLRL